MLTEAKRTRPEEPMSRLAIVIAALAIGLLAAPVRADVSAGERKKLEKAFADYLRQPDAKKRAKTWKGVKALAGKLTFEEIEELVGAAVPGNTWKKGFTPTVKYTSLGEEWTYSVIAPKKRPKGLLPLVVDPGHGSWRENSDKENEGGMRTWLKTAGAENDVIYIRTRVIDRLSNDGRYDAWSKARQPMDQPNSDSIATALLDAINDACLRYPVDPDRVFVQGISQTGYWTWWLGQYAPDRFAAIAPVGSRTLHMRQLVGNCTAVPVFLLHGTADPTCPFGDAKWAADALKKRGGTVDFRPTEGGGHMNGVFVRFGEIWPDMAKLTRNPFPKKFERKLVGPTRPDAYWLRALGVEADEFNPWGAPARVTGEIDGQTLRITAEGCEKVVVLLGTEMLDLDESVTIELNGRKVHKKRVKPDAETALEVARLRSDGGHFSAAVTLTVR